jgi:hypothetical protein
MPDVIEATARDADPVPEPEPGTEVEHRQPTPGDVAVAQAAEHALAMPGVPGRDEFLSLAMQARMLSLSGAAPEAVRNSPYVAFHVAMVGRDLGISPSAALELIDVISTSKGPQLSLSPQLMNGQIRRLGLGEIVKGHSDTTSCTAIAVGPEGRDRRCRLRWPEHVDDCACDILGSFTFTWEDARVAGLVAQGCMPGDHTVKCMNRQTHPAQRCNQGYVTYPQRMLWWRASGYLADDTFPEAGMGLYSPEELGAVVDDQGRPIDVASVELPPGYEQAAIGRATDAEPAPAHELWDLQARLHGLPPDQQAAWRTQKSQQDRLKGIPTYQLPAAAMRLAKSLVSGLESAAKKADPTYDPDTAATLAKVEAFRRLADVLCNGDPEPTPVEPPAPPEAAEGTVTPPEAPAAPQAPAGGPTVADADVVRANFEQVVRRMSVADVKRDLAEYKLPTTGGAEALRALLVGHLVATEMGEQT